MSLLQTPSCSQKPAHCQFCLAALALVTTFLVLAMPLVLTSAGGTSGASDQETYHLPIIRTMAEDWPRVDVRHYNSATTPLYHFVMSGVYRHITGRVAVLQGINTAIACVLLLLVFCGASRGVRPWPALALTLPLAFSSYTLGSGVWLTTDNLGLLFVAMTLLSALWQPATPASHLWRGAAAMLAVLTRQIHLWLVAPIALSGWPMEGGLYWPRGLSRREIITRILACLAPVAAVACFVVLWRGLTPPGFQQQHASGANPATPAMVLALAGVFGAFYLPAAWNQLKTLSVRDVSLWLAVIGALLTTVAIPTNFDQSAGRWGGAIWEVVRHMPAVGGRSILFPPLAVAGATVILMLYRQARAAGHRQEALLLLISMLAWLMVQSANHQAWQRYCEPILLIALAWLTSMGTPSIRRWWLGPLALCVGLLVLDLASSYRALIGLAG